jgi:4-amino-4-deoxychorismate lyase
MIVVNGTAGGALDPLDRGFAYGDGVFRTLRVNRGRPVQWRRHYAKLAADCAALDIPCPAQASLEHDLGLAGVGETPEQTAKIVVTRGCAMRGYAYASDRAPTRVVFVTAGRPYPLEYGARGVRVRKCRLTLAAQPALAGIKHLNRLENVLARSEWRDAAIAEGLLCDAQEHVIGGTMTNVFIASGGELATPALTRCGVAGVTRARVIELAQEAGIRCAVRDVSWRELLEADEIVLTNALAGVWPVCEIDGALRNVGAVSEAIRSWLEHDDAREA